MLHGSPVQQISGDPPRGDRVKQAAAPRPIDPHPCYSVLRLSGLSMRRSTAMLARKQAFIYPPSSLRGDPCPLLTPPRLPALGSLSSLGVGAWPRRKLVDKNPSFVVTVVCGNTHARTSFPCLARCVASRVQSNPCDDSAPMNRAPWCSQAS
ncbi:uncharacterized protein UV8b_07483 [Ustilaginoidea virens]|uniref:Uncharacterized protein n=1 Tax=Ustilaginoidea virens TaxID=1159556 RepID=A0A8E5ML20_USTVR|nr:uncharacterized protein UV8b_07483 [Ustilaginoidea virens]QUC23242.1 hypothetical protein UV8b_07483 [Ustilaginoidea virens]